MDDGISDIPIGEYKVRSQGYLQCRGLGSCIALYLYESVHKIGSLAHIFLPMSVSGQDTNWNIVNAMIQEMKSKNADRLYLQAKIIGGAQLFSAKMENIGKLNIDEVLFILQELRIPIVGMDIGENYARSTLMDLKTGKVEVSRNGQKYTKI